MFGYPRALWHRSLARMYERLAQDRIQRRRYHDMKARELGYPRPRAAR